MTQVEFEMSRSLLRDVIAKQTGSVVKAVKELVQNARDAGATIIDIKLDKKGVIVRDNGVGMNKSTIDKYFRVFGDTTKRHDKNCTGEFGMGRGQIMPFGRCVWHTENTSLYVNIKDFLGYKESIRENHYVDGTVVVCSFYKELRWYYVDSKVTSIRNEILPGDLKITVNGRILPKITNIKEKYSNKEFDVFTHKNVIRYLYVQGLFIKELEGTFDYCINVKTKVELNFARNNILETDPINEKIFDKFKILEKLVILKKTQFESYEATKVIELTLAGVLDLEDIKDKRILELSNGVMVSLSDIEHKDILYGENNIWSNDCASKGYIILNKGKDFRYDKLFKMFDLKITVDDTDVKDLSSRGYHRDSVLSELKRNKAYGFIPRDMNEVIFIPYFQDDDVDDDDNEWLRKVDLGESDISDSWTDGYSSIHINKDLIETNKSKELIVIECWRRLCHEYTHTDSNIEIDEHNDNFYREFSEIIKETAEALARYMRYVSVKYLKEKYELDKK